MTYAGGARSWQSRLKKSVALSTTEVEYMVAIKADNDVIWMKDFIQELEIQQEEFQLHCDKQSVIDLAKNVSCHSRTKYIERRYHWLWESVEGKESALRKIHTEQNGSDMLTEMLSTEKLDVCRRWIGMASHPMPG